MINTEKKLELMKQFEEGIKANVSANLSELNLVGFCGAGKMDLVKEAVEKIRANIISAVPTGYPIPKASLYVNGTGNGSNVTVISITLTNGWKDTQEFKFSNQFPVGENIVTVITAFFQAAYEKLFMDVLADENLKVINDMFEDFCKKAGLGYTVKVVSPLNQDGKKIAYIADDAIEFVADEDRLFNIDDILVFQDADALITEEQIEAAKQPLIDELGLAQTTVQLVGAHGGSLIKYLCGIGTQVKAITLIRKVNNKNAERLTGKKDSVAYYEKDGVYSVVARRDGKFEVLLKPFDVKTLANVDVDVVKELTA